MKRLSLIKTRQCSACGAEISRMLELCPYCGCEQPDVERISPEIRAEIMEGLNLLNCDLFMSGIPILWRALYWIGSLHIFLLPLIFVGFAFFIIENEYLTALLIFAGLALSWRPVISFYQMYSYSYGTFFEKRLWRRKIKAKVIELLRQHKVPEGELDGVMWDYLQNEKESGEWFKFRAALYD